MLLDQDANETLQAANDGAVQHDRSVTCAVFPHVLGVQPLGHGEIDLHGAALPLAPDRVFQRVFNFGAIKSAVAGRNLELAT